MQLFAARLRRYAEHCIDYFAGAFWLEGSICHQPPEKDHAEECQRSQLRIDMSWKLTDCNALGDHIDEWLARLLLEAVVELSQVSIAFSTIDKRWDAGGEGGAGHNIGNVTYNSLNPLAR